MKPRGPRTADAFDKVPRWIARAHDFRTMGELECKLLLLIASRRRWSDNAYPLTTIDELAQTVGARFKRTSKALHDLASIGAITVTEQRRSKRIILCFTPFQATKTKDKELDVHLEVPRRTTLDEDPGQTGRQTGRREDQNGRRTQIKNEPDPAWVTEHDTARTAAAGFSKSPSQETFQ